MSPSFAVLLISATVVVCFENTDQPAPWRFGIAAKMSTAARQVVKKVLSVEQDEGEGARVRRSVGRPEVCTWMSPAHIIKYACGISGICSW